MVLVAVPRRRARSSIAAALALSATSLVAREAEAQAKAEPQAEKPQSDESEAATEPKADEQDENIEKKAQNPLSDLIRVNFQDNVNFDAGPERRTQNVLNIQSTVRLWLGKKWLLLNRSQLPIISQPLPPGQRTFGLGDVLMTFFVSPRELAGPFIWGVGPTVTLPAATDVVLGAGKWALGPSAAAITVQGRWLLGFIAIQTWSFAGAGDRPRTSNLLFQPVIAYAFDKTWAVSTSPIITVDWTRAPSDRWTIPVGPQIAKAFDLGSTKLEISTGWFWNIVHPDNAPQVQLRLQAAFLFPM